MIQKIKSNWIEILAIGAIFAGLLICNLPAMTWINTDSDGCHYILAAKHMLPAHNTSAPLFLLIGRLFLFLPFGTDAWLMGLISVLSTTICSILIYKVVRHHLSEQPKERLYAITASLIYGGSALVISQSTIIESYALATMFSVLAYYLSLKKKWVWVSVVIGLLWATHTIFAWSTWAILLFKYKELRNIPLAVITLLFLGFYAYIPIVTAINGDIGMWNNTTLQGFFEGQWGVLWMLTGGLSLWDMPKRILDTLGIYGVSMGIGIIMVIIGMIKYRKGYWELILLISFPLVYFATNLAAETYVYIMPAIAFGATYTGIILSKLNIKWAYATVAVAVALMVFNINYFDIGRTLDPNLSAQRYYDEELPKIGDGEIYLGGGWTWAIVYLYNMEEGRNIIPICTDILPSNDYLDKIESDGIKLVRTDSESFVDKQWAVAQTIAELNDNVWLAKETIPEEYQYEIVRADVNMNLITRWLGHEVEPKIAWKPSNPYDFITGSLEVKEWKFILKSNHNARNAIVWAIYGLGAVWLFNKIFRRKKNETETKTEKETNTTTS